MLYSHGPLSHAGTARGGKSDGSAIESVTDRGHGKSRDANGICPAIVATETIYTLIVTLSCDQVCNDFQLLL